MTQYAGNNSVAYTQTQLRQERIYNIYIKIIRKLNNAFSKK